MKEITKEFIVDAIKNNLERFTKIIIKHAKNDKDLDVSLENKDEILSILQNAIQDSKRLDFLLNTQSIVLTEYDDEDINFMVATPCYMSSYEYYSTGETERKAIDNSIIVDKLRKGLQNHVKV